MGGYPARVRTENLLVEDKPWVDVTHPTYGAMGDGSTSDSAAISSAEAAADDSGGTLYFPVGTYRLTSDVTISSNVHLRIEPGATFTRSASQTLTIYSPEKVMAAPKQQITAVDMISFSTAGVAYAGWWGAKADTGTTNNRNPIMWALNSMPEGGTVIVPEDSGHYYYDHALFGVDGQTLIIEGNETRMVCDESSFSTGYTKWPLYNSFCFGSWQTNNYADITAKYALDAITLGDESVTTSTAGHAGNFTAGDVCLVRTTSTWNNGTDDISTWGQPNVVKLANGSTGVIDLRYPIQNAGTAEIVNMSDHAGDFLYSDDSDTGYDHFATRDMKIIGGTWQTATAAAVTGFEAGAVDCTVDIHRVISKSPPGFGNMLAHCKMKVDIVEATRKLTDLSLHSCNNIIEYRTVEVDDSASTDPDGIMEITGASYNNRVYVHTLMSDATYDHFVNITAGWNNQIKAGHAVVAQIAKELVKFNSPSFTGTPPDTYGNSFEGNRVDGGGGNRYVLFTGARCYNNEVRNTNFFGAVSAVAVYSDASKSGYINRLVNVWAENDQITLADTTQGLLVNGCTFPGGIAITIVSGAISAANGGLMRVNGQGGAADDLDTINAGIHGQVLILTAGNTNNTITVKHNTGNIKLDSASDYALDNSYDTLTLVYDDHVNYWLQIASSNVGA